MFRIKSGAPVAVALAITLSGCGPKAAPETTTPPPAPIAATPVTNTPDSNPQAPAGEESSTAFTAQAKITDAAARATALAQIPGGTIKEGGLEKEDGKLLYSFDIAVAGKSGVEEVQVDAITGKVLSNVHETPADEAKEAKADSGKAKAAAGVKKP